MILRTTTGKSFKGVGKYVLHDKGAQSTERVSFIETENLAFSDGQRAIAEMIHTATRQKALRRANGNRATATGKPVYHYSLSWDTSESPSLQEQIEAGRQSLKALGLGDRQAMIVGHTDTDNPHVHVVVNLVCPVTGDTASLSNDHVKLSKWAQKYRADRGEEHFCPQRKKNNARRDNGEFVKADNLSRQEYEAWKKSQTKDIWDSFRADRAKARDDRKPMYDALWRQKEERFALRRAEIKQLYKPIWRDVFKRQRDELKTFDNGFFGRLKVVRDRGRLGIGALFQAVFDGAQMRADLIHDHEAERGGVAREQKSRIADASREVTKAYKYDQNALKDMHEREDQQKYWDTKAKSAEVWQQPAPEQSKPDFEKSSDRRDPQKKVKRRSFEAFFGGDEKAIAEARKAQKKVREQNRKRNRTRKRDRDDGGREFDM